MNDPVEEYTEPPEELLREMERTLTLKVTSAQAILHTLRQADEFLSHHAGPAVGAELHALCALHGWDTNAFLDGIGLHALALRWAIDAATDTADHTDYAGGTAGAEHDKETT
jgi:hypothetical protein